MFHWLQLLAKLIYARILHRNRTRRATQSRASVCDRHPAPFSGYGSVVLVEKRRGRDQGARYALKISSLSRAALVERDILPRLRGLPYTTDLAYAFFTASPPRAFLALRE